MPGEPSSRRVALVAKPRPDRRGLVAAYLLVLGLIAGTAGAAFGDLRGAAPQIVDSAVAASPPPPAVDTIPTTEPEPAAATIQSLPLPRRPGPTGFRTPPPDDLAGLIETTDDGLRLPSISPSGWMPWIAHARRFDPAGAPARLGLLVINVGVNEAMMRRAIEDLPPEVSLAFLPSTPDLPRWLALARASGHETYLMMPTDDPALAERGIRPIEATVDAAENVRRLRATLARGEGYVGLVIPAADRAAQSETAMRPVIAEIAARGLALIEINPAPGVTTIQRLTAQLGVGYARSSDVLDYKLAGDGVGGNIDRLAGWVAETAPDRPPRHAFGVMQPEDDAITAIAAWFKGQQGNTELSFVPIIGHFECRDACMTRLRAQPAQLRP
ncbi:divergent polysaccharide deacetylase family protein [Reyranella sp.]|uniref:divergent polysaccharide deacetylase family protein n=1 Tax=Reyranella sp. TaxID=1929291 RepID=UPI0040355824